MLAHPMQVLEILLRKIEEPARNLADSFCGELPDTTCNIQSILLPAPERLAERSGAIPADAFSIIEGKVEVGIAKDAGGERYAASGSPNKRCNKIPNQPGHVSSLLVFLSDGMPSIRGSFLLRLHHREPI